MVKEGIPQPIAATHMKRGRMILPKVWYFFSAASTVFLMPYLYLYFSTVGGLTDAQLGVVSALRPWCSALANLALPPLADGLNCHKSIVLISFATATFLRLGLFYMIGKYQLLLVVLLASEFLASPVGAIVDAMVVATSAKGQGYGRQRLWASVGWGGLSCFGGLLLDRQGFGAAFFTFAVLSVPCLVVLSLFSFEKDTASPGLADKACACGAAPKSFEHEETPLLFQDVPSACGKTGDFGTSGQPPRSDGKADVSGCPSNRTAGPAPEGEGKTTARGAAILPSAVHSPEVVTAGSLPKGLQPPEVGEERFSHNEVLMLPQDSAIDHYVAISPPVGSKGNGSGLTTIAHVYVTMDGDAHSQPIVSEDAHLAVRASSFRLRRRTTTSVVAAPVRSGDIKDLALEKGQQLGDECSAMRDEGSDDSSASLGRCVARLLSSGTVLSFLARCFLLGFGTGVIGTFLFIYTADLGASHALLGLMLTANCVAEVPVFFYAEYIKARWSTDALLRLAIGVLVGRLLAYVVLPLLPGCPWSVLPVEFLQGFTFALAWAVCADHCKIVAPPELQTTMQGLMQAVYWGVAGGAGGIVGAMLHERLGGQVMFAITAALVAFGWALLAAVEMLAGQYVRTSTAAASETSRRGEPTHLHGELVAEEATLLSTHTVLPCSIRAGGEPRATAGGARYPSGVSFCSSAPTKQPPSLYVVVQDETSTWSRDSIDDLSVDVGGCSLSPSSQNACVKGTDSTGIDGSKACSTARDPSLVLGCGGGTEGQLIDHRQSSGEDVMASGRMGLTGTEAAGMAMAQAAPFATVRPALHEGAAADFCCSSAQRPLLSPAAAQEAYAEDVVQSALPDSHQRCRAFGGGRQLFNS